MPSRPVGDFVQFSIGGGWGSEEPQEGFAPVAVIRGTDIPRLKNGDFSSIPKRFESEKKLNSRLLVPGDIVLETAGGSAGTGQFTGRSLLVTEGLLATTGTAICASFCKRIQVDTGSVEPAFFQLFLEEMYSSGRVALYDSQSTGISNFQFKSFLKDELVDFPELPIQRAISRVFGDIDAKRIRNFEVSQKLEELASALFRSWFVDYDPVKAKMAGEAPVGMDAETAALFPDSMEESDLGEIPTGWRHQTLGELALAKKGRTITRASSVEGKIPVVAGGLEPAYFHNKPNVNGPVVTISASGANAGFVRLYGQDVWASDCSFFSRDETQHVYFVYSFLKHHQDKVFGMQQGAAQPHIYGSDLARLAGNFPSEISILGAFEKAVAPLFELQEMNRRQNSMLSEIRDALLPRLISGELKIPDEMLAA